MILIPALFAAVLFSISDKKAGGKGSGSEGAKSGRETLVTEASEENDAGRDTAGNDSDLEEADSENDGEAEMASDQTASAEPPAGTTGQTPALYDPVQEISFIPASGAGNGLQRSVPVDIDAAILGGEAYTRCWAVFLPAEIENQPGIVFSKYQKVTFVPLGEAERLGTGRLWNSEGRTKEEKRGEDGSRQENGEDTSPPAQARDYYTGDTVDGLTNGSAFRVRMTSEDGSVQETDLYVFSCRDTASMYLDTESGSMENVDSDPTKQKSESALFAVFRPDGALDSAGNCSVRGRGNSTWNMNKRPYNLNLAEKQSVLGMQACKKLCLLANTFDSSNLLDRISSRMAAEMGMRDTPQGEFVNLYLNGRYNGLYYLSQRPRPGGSVNIKKLDDDILMANGQLPKSGNTAGKDKTSVKLPKRIALHEEGSRLNKWAYNWPNEPDIDTGGYLLQQYSRYGGSGCWFSTNHRRFRIMSPSYPTVGEVNYLSEYMLSAERAIYSEDGIDPETGKSYMSYLDMPSWEDMFLLEEFFAEWDAEKWSFYVIKDRGDPLLYCGPMWDFDHSAGSMIYGTYPETAVSMLLFRDTRHGWLYKLLSHDAFVEELHARWRERFSPMVHNYLDNELETEVSAIETSAYMNNIRRANDYDYREKTGELGEWLRRRLAFLDDYLRVEDGKEKSENYCRVLFEFSWGELSHYVPRGESLGYLPLPEYGETQIVSQVEKNEIIGWKDEKENVIGPEIVIDTDRTFSPVYR